MDTSLKEKIKLALESGRSIIAEAVKTGKIYADKDLVDTRINICFGCTKLDHKTIACKVCGCFMSLKAKLKATRCPINKW